MSVKLKVLSAGALFFLGIQTIDAQKKKTDSVKTKNIEGVVILRYGKTATKPKSVTASTTISSSVLENRPSSSFLTSVQGAAPGISINSSSGSPGSGKIDVSVRGKSSINSSTDPLYVIDGLISSSTEFRNLNPNDIETLSILRDAQATSIYGNFGANGVVVITTKSGKYNSGLRISYDVVTSVADLPNHKYDLTNSKELLSIQKKFGKGLGKNLTEQQIENYGINTDWKKEFFRTSFTQQHNIGLRFGGENFSSYSSLGYLENEGVIKSTDFKRFTVRNNINGRSKDRKFNYSAQIGLGYSKRHQLHEETDSSISANSVMNPLLGLFAQSIISPYRYKNGRELFETIGNFSGGQNALLLADIINGGIKKEYTQTSISANANASYQILDGLSIGNKTGITYKNNMLIYAYDPNGYHSVYIAKRSKTEYGGSETIQNTFDTTLNSVTSLSYDKKLGNHTLGLGAYVDYLRGFYSSTSQVQNGLDPLNWAFGAGTGYVPFNTKTPNLYRPTISAERTKAETLAFIGTLDYDFSSKYGLSATIRRDASYRFSKENKWETFWSVGGRWNINKESFMEGSIFNDLKLRASYGTNGNQNLAPSTINTNPLFLSSNLVRDTYESNTGYENLPGYATSLKNSNIRWEKIAQANIGLDFGILRNKVQGTLDVYEKKTTDMFLDIPISGITGQYTIKGNNGSVRNRGIEASLRYTPFNKEDFRLSVFTNFAYNKNEIIELPNEDLSDDNVNAIGGSIAQWQLYPYAGVNPDTGNYWFRDKNGNLTESPKAEDRVLTGKSVYAPYNGGFGLDIDYKGFYLTSLFSFQAGGWSFDNLHNWLNLPEYAQRFNLTKEMLNAWTPNNKFTDIASLHAANIDLLGSSDKFLRKTDFIKLKNLAIGYNIPKDFIKDLPVKSLKVYLMGENLITWTGWKGFDPEPLKSYSIGVYPNPRTYSLGLNLEF